MKAYKSKKSATTLSDLKALRAASRLQLAPPPSQSAVVTPKMRAAAKYAVPDSQSLKKEFHHLLQTEALRTDSLSSTDKLLFKRSMQGVTPISRSGRTSLPDALAIAPEEAKAKQYYASGSNYEPLALAHTSDQYIATSFEEDPSEYLNPACGTDVMRNLKRNRWAISASLDLHGATLDEARQLVNDFINECIEHRLKCIRIVHGVGYGSKGENGPVLLPTVRRWLAQLHDVLAYTECAPNEGGKGAVKVLLRSYR